MENKTIKRIYIKLLKFKIKQDGHVDKHKIKLNKRFSNKIQTAEDLQGIIRKTNVVAALGWNGNS